MNLAEMLAKADAETQGVEINTTEYKPLPPGDYTVVVTEAEGPIATTRANPMNPSEFGQQIKMKLTVSEGQYKNRTIFFRNNIICFPATMSAEDVAKSKMAMAMGNNERTIIMASLGLSGIENAVQLVGATFKVKLDVKPYKGKDQNNVVRVMPLNGTLKVPGKPVPAPTAQTDSAPTAKPKMPWEK